MIKPRNVLVLKRMKEGGGKKQQRTEGKMQNRREAQSRLALLDSTSQKHRLLRQ